MVCRYVFYYGLNRGKAKYRDCSSAALATSSSELPDDIGGVKSLKLREKFEKYWYDNYCDKAKPGFFTPHEICRLSCLPYTCRGQSVQWRLRLTTSSIVLHRWVCVELRTGVLGGAANLGGNWVNSLGLEIMLSDITSRPPLVVIINYSLIKKKKKKKVTVLRKENADLYLSKYGSQGERAATSD